MNLNLEVITNANRQINDHEKIINGLKHTIRAFAEPLFSAQRTVAAAIENEDEFALFRNRYGRPFWKLATRAWPTGEYLINNNRLYQECQYEDGEWATSIELLPEFLEDDVSAQREAVRNFYRNYLTEEEKESEARRMRRLAEAKKILSENGIDINF